MKHLGPATALLLALSAPLRAQGQGTELFGGYSYARISDASRHGGHAAVAFDLRSPLGLKVDLSAHFGSGGGTDLSDLTLMAGPVFRFGRGGTVFFLHALAGLYRERASLSVFDVSISESESRFGALSGGGLDLRIARRWAVRLEGLVRAWRGTFVGAACSGPLRTRARRAGMATPKATSPHGPRARSARAGRGWKTDVRRAP